MHYFCITKAEVITNGFGAITSMFSKRKHKAVSPEDFLGKEAKKNAPAVVGARAGAEGLEQAY